MQGSGFRVEGSGFRVQGRGFRVGGSGLGVQGRGFRVQGWGFGVVGPGLRIGGPRLQFQRLLQQRHHDPQAPGGFPGDATPCRMTGVTSLSHVRYEEI